MEALNAAIELNGMFQKELISRLIERFALLDRPSQQLLLGTLASEYADDAGDRLKARLVELIQADEQQHLGDKAQAEAPLRVAAKATPKSTGKSTPRSSGKSSKG